MLKIKDSELKAILAEVETEIGQLLKSESDKAGAKLEKAHPGEPLSSELPPDESAMKPADASPEASAGPDAGASPAAPPEPDADASAAPPAEEAPSEGEGEGDPAADETSDPEALKAEYAKLDIEELKSHYLAAKAALFEMMGQGSPADAGEDASAPPAPSPEMTAPAALPPPAMKSEAPAKGEPLAKAEDKKNEEIETLKGKLAKTEEAVEKLVSAMTMVISRPERKAITNLDFVPKTQEPKPTLSKSEVLEKLNVLTKSPTLKKTDRELINMYCSGGANFEKIEHLFVESK